MSGRGSRDSGMNTTRISFLALHSFLNRSILAAASSLIGDPELWVGAGHNSAEPGVKKTRAGRRVEVGRGEPGTTSQGRKEGRREVGRKGGRKEERKEGSGLLRARKSFARALFTHRERRSAAGERT